jgi:hypothetical protein
MEVVSVDDGTMAVLRAIARAGFAYGAAKELCGAAGWRLLDDEPELGYARYNIPLPSFAGVGLLTIQFAESGSPPWAFVPLDYFEEYDDTREPFDRAYLSLAEQLARFLGTPSRSGEYSYPHRPGWSYSFTGWRLLDATVVLVQDEMDIQFGMDVTLWVQPAGTAVEAPVQIS